MISDRGPDMVDEPNNFAQAATIEFCHRVLDIHSTMPHVTVRELTRAWRELSRACWVWVWLKNTAPKVNQWELICDETENASGEASNLPGELAMGCDCLSEYSALRREVLILEDLEQEFTHEGKGYRCGVAKDLVEQGCQTLIVVPFLAEDLTSRDRGIVGSVCLHYRRPWREVLGHGVLADGDLLKMMGQITGHVLRGAFQYQFLSVLVELNDIASQCLARFGRARESRSRYLEKLIKVIQESVEVKYVSVFYEQPFTRSVQCLATTGLYREDGGGEGGGWKSVPDGEVATARYAMNEGLTGECYANGEVYQKPSNVVVEHARKYVEQSAASGDPNSFILIPILPTESGRNVGAEAPKAMGVIRVSGHTAENYRDHRPDHDRNFNSIEVETLRFIAAQAAPVLETFNFRIQREHSVGIIKHELYAPLKMIRDTCDQVVGDQRRGLKVRSQDLEDISASCLFAENLVPQLSEDPQAAAPLAPQRTFLEGDIVARVKDMLSHYAREAKEMYIEFGDFRDKENPSRSIPPLMVDPVLIERVLCNLIINAIKYGQEKTRILVDPYLVPPGDGSAGASGAGSGVSPGASAGTGASPGAGAMRLPAGVYIEVSNYGIGIEADEEKFIFEPYFRTRQARTVAQGAGLGLTIGGHIMAQHGGHLKLIRRTDPTIFQMYFPQNLICDDRVRRGGP